MLLGRGNKPVARLMPLAPETPVLKIRRPIGLAQGAFKLAPAFFEPLDDDLLDLWEGKFNEGGANVRTRRGLPIDSREFFKRRIALKVLQF